MPERLTPADAAEVDAFCRRSFRPATRNEIAMESRILDLLDERDALLDILERLHSVQDGCPLHKYNTVWVKAMEDAQAAFDRAGGGS